MLHRCSHRSILRQVWKHCCAPLKVDERIHNTATFAQPKLFCSDSINFKNHRNSPGGIGVKLTHSHNHDHKTIDLRPYQSACIEATLEHIAKGHRRLAVSLPVGSGKTVVLSRLIPLIPSSGHRKKTLVLAHRTELLDQAKTKISSANPLLRVTLEQGAQFADEDADVVVASVPTLGRKGSTRISRLDPADFKCIIIDEAHHATASTYLRVLEYFGARSSDTDIVVWGCSATLQRHDGISLGAVFDTVCYQRSIMDMWEEGWLCPARAVRIRTGTDLRKLRVNSSTMDFSQPQLAAAVNNAQRNTIIVDAWREHVHLQGRTTSLVFCVDVEHTKTLQAAFIAEGVPAIIIHGSTPREERADLLNRFRNGSLPVLINCAVFTEGTDIPRIDCVILARPTRSSVLFQQMVGRGLRLCTGKSDCLILDLNDNFGRNTAVTVPSLLGLVPEFDVNGGDVYDAYKKIKGLSEDSPDVIFASCLDDAVHRVKQHRLNLIGHSSTNADSESSCLRLHSDTHLPDASELSGLSYVRMSSEDSWYALGMDDYGFQLPLNDREWPESSANYLVQISGLGTVRIYQDTSTSLYVARFVPVKNLRQRYSIDGDVFSLPLTAETIEQAFAAVRSYLQREFPTEFRETAFGKWSKPSNEPATEKQIKLLTNLIGAARVSAMSAKSVDGTLSKGYVSNLIDKVLNSSRKQKLKLKAARGRAQKATAMVAGLVPKVDEDITLRPPGEVDKTQRRNI